MKRVLSVPNAAEAHVAVAALENAGIEAVIRGEHMGALPLGAGSQPSVWVEDEDYGAAREVLGLPAQDAKSGERPVSTKSLLWIIVAMLLAIVALRVLQAIR